MKTSKISAAVLSMALVLSMVPMVSAADLTEGAKGSITLNNAVENDKFSAYKVIDITYDAATNTLAHGWNDAFDDYFTISVEEFSELTADELKTTLAGLPQYIIDNSVTPVKSEITASSTGSALFDQLDMGGYFIRPTATTHVYNTIFGKVEPTVNGTKYELNPTNQDITAKHNPVSVTKASDKESSTKGETITYTIEAELPTYDSNAAYKVFSLSDLMAEGITFDTTSVQVYKVSNVADTGDTLAVATTDYTLNTTATSDYTFEVSVSNTQYANWSTSSYSKIKVVYTASLNDNAVIAGEGNNNAVTYEYSTYPYVDVETDTKTTLADVDVYTYGLVVNKVDSNDSTKLLEGAKFDLYRDAAAGETGVTLTDINNPVVLLATGLTTDSDGLTSQARLEANGTSYNYYLVETTAPSGYNLLTAPVVVNFTKDDVDATGDYTGYYNITVENKSGIILPITGGTGTLIFTIVGIVLMGGAIVLFVISKKKSKSNKE